MNVPKALKKAASLAAVVVLSMPLLAQAATDGFIVPLDKDFSQVTENTPTPPSFLNHRQLQMASR